MSTNPSFSHPGQPNMFVQVIQHSRSPVESAPDIFTIHARYPRIIHGEIMTHRVFGRNARSSRAVPVATMLNEIIKEPFMPWHWGKNQKGMQADEECNELVQVRDHALDYDEENTFGETHKYVTREQAWRHARNMAVDSAQAFSNANYHKQVVNRLIEPFSWIDTLITSTSWANFLHLRDHEDAEPHFRDLARLFRKAMDSSTPNNLDHNQWHLPYITDDDLVEIRKNLRSELFGAEPGMVQVYEMACRVSAARCARISYKPFNGKASISAELERYNLLMGSTPVHASPTEHQAAPDTVIPGDNLRWANSQFHGNLTGWIQSRKLISDEYMPD